MTIQEIEPAPPLVTNDAIVFGMLMVILGFVFWGAARETGFWKKFYSVVPALLMCYFLPSLLSTANVISGEKSQLYFVASRYLLPTSLVLLTLSIDLRAIGRLGPKALIMFATGTVGIVLGGPLAIIIVSYINVDAVTGEPGAEVWRGLTTVAGSWIGGGANQLAMKETFNVGDELFSALIAVDVIVANIWMAVLLYASGRERAIDKRIGADASAITSLKERITRYQAEILKIPNLPETMILLAFGFGVTAVSHQGSEWITGWLSGIADGDPEHFLSKTSLTNGFFWLIVLATTGGVVLSFTGARRLEGVGASRIGSVFIWVLVATIGMNMDLLAILEHPWLFLIGAIWIGFHAILMIVVAILIKAPVFFLAVGSQANIGGAASAPVVASAFHPSLAPVGVLLAVLGYALGTYAAWACGLLMQMVAPGTSGV